MVKRSKNTVHEQRPSTDEARRIQEVYARRDASGKRGLYSLFNAPALYAAQSVERALVALLKKHSLSDLGPKAILDVGCGTGATLRTLVSLGADPARCQGIDLLGDRIDDAKRLSPNMGFVCANAETLPYPDGGFDMLVSFTVFSSILDPAMRSNLAGEMLRVLKNGGAVVWYDYHVDNPRNPDVRGVKRAEIGELFPGCMLDLRKVTLAPPLARAVAPFSLIACDILEKVYYLRTHYLGIIRKTG